MKFYLASRYSRREGMVEVARQLTEAIPGATLCSRWVKGEHVTNPAWGGEAYQQALQRFAREDWEDVLHSHTLILFTEEPRSTNSRGARFAEFGAAYALGKRCIIVGPHENVFCWLPGVMHFERWGECLSALIEIEGWRNNT